MATRIRPSIQICDTCGEEREWYVLALPWANVRHATRDFPVEHPERREFCKQSCLVLWIGSEEARRWMGFTVFIPSGESPYRNGGRE